MFSGLLDLPSSQKFVLLFVFIIPCCRYMFRSLFDHLQEEYTILVSGNYYIDNGSVALYKKSNCKP
jgi:hypothetical protein